MAADAELRRRHPGQPWPPLRSAEPEPRHDSSTPADDLAKTSRLIEDLAARHREFAAKLSERQSMMISAGDPGFQDISPAFPAWTSPGKDAILQPPKPQIQPSQRVLEQAAGRDCDREAAD